MIRNGFGGVKVMKFDEYYKKIGLRNIKENELLDTLNSSASCIFPEEIERAFLSGGDLWFFLKRICVMYRQMERNMAYKYLGYVFNAPKYSVA